MKKAIIAMSGGVDSSVAAYLCVKNGYECIGATMKLFNNEDIGKKEEKTCCSLEDIEDARSVAAKLDMPYYVFNFTDEFDEKVIKKFICAYETGATPNPCIDCNRYLKFDKLFNRMKELDFDYVVTGHYARISYEGGRYLLKKAVDESKDQSYVLYSMTQEQLAHTLFPLGDYTKPHIREIAEKNGFINAKKHDSQDICFVPDGDYAAFIEQYSGKKYPKGNFVDKNGSVLGMHKGIIRYTIGQRKGLGLSLPKPMYVCSKDIDKNEVVLCDNEELFSSQLDADDFNWITFDNPPETVSAKARIRYNQKEEPAKITVTGEKSVHIEFDKPQRAIAKGQAVVLYDGDVVLGGGTIQNS
ncbi:MAG: tRNA 2-thiouridine(34) synthase MnmA [Clostridiales bacterium]|nr:tRNA 2-thiouridine(34) synthase MnmA [Clostridiales bacterium]